MALAGQLVRQRVALSLDMPVALRYALLAGGGMILASSTASVICAVFLIAAGLLKIKSLSSFGDQIVAYQVLPVGIARLAGYLLPFIEIVLGAALLLIPRLGFVAAPLFVSFGIAVGLNLLRGRTELRCGCFGASGKHTISFSHLGGNVLLTALALFGAINALRPTFIAVQLGVSAVLLAVLWQTLRTMKPDSAVDSAGRR